MNLESNIESKRLEFRIPSEKDSNGLSVLMQENKNIECKFFGSGFLAKENLVNLYNMNDKNKCSSNKIIFSIYTKSNYVFIGLCGLKIDSKNFKGKVFYVLLSDYKRNGYAIESIKMLLDLAFSRLSLDQVIAEIPYNFRNAWKPVERAGMKYMGDFKTAKQKSRFLLFVIDKKEYLNQVFY